MDTGVPGRGRGCTSEYTFLVEGSSSSRSLKARLSQSWRMDPLWTARQTVKVFKGTAQGFGVWLKPCLYLPCSAAADCGHHCQPAREDPSDSSTWIHSAVVLKHDVHRRKALLQPADSRESRHTSIQLLEGCKSLTSLPRGSRKEKGSHCRGLCACTPNILLDTLGLLCYYLMSHLYSNDGRCRNQETRGESDKGNSYGG